MGYCSMNARLPDCPPQEAAGRIGEKPILSTDKIPDKNGRDRGLRWQDDQPVADAERAVIARDIGEAYKALGIDTEVVG